MDVTEFGAKLVQRCSGRALTVIVKLNEENVVGLDRATAGPAAERGRKMVTSTQQRGTGAEKG